MSINGTVERVKTPPRCLTIAGSDSGGGAGIQADLKAFTALGTYGLSCLTALTAQDTKGVHSVEAVLPDFVAAQLQTVLKDIGCDAFKTGMLHNARVISAVVLALRTVYLNSAALPPFVLDPVMVSTSGHTLLDEAAIATLRAELIPLATVLTPNLPEALILAGRGKDDTSYKGLEGMKALARDLGKLGCRHVLLKGGHAEGDELFDVLYDVKAGKEIVFTHKKIATSSTHGTGCTLSAALCAYLAMGMTVPGATQLAIDYIQGALRASFQLGAGAGPVNHIYNISQRSLPLPTSEDSHPFTTHLIRSAGDTWEDYVWRNPFVQGLRDGTLPMESFVHFLKQDYHFLLHYARVHALAAYKSDTFEEIEAATDILRNIIHESKLHIQTCAKHGITRESMIDEPEGELTVAYTRYVLDLANAKSLLHLRVATAPCLFGYGEIANRLLAPGSGLKREGNPYMYWIEEYGGGPFQEAVRIGRDLLEDIVKHEGISANLLKELVQVFNTATRLECGFFEQGLKREYRVMSRGS